MSNKLKIRVLDVKSLTDYIVREEETYSADRYAKLEAFLQNTDINEVNKSISDSVLEVGSYVAVHVNPFNKKSPPIWLRAIIKNIFHRSAGFLYSVYLCDYGMDENVYNRTQIKELKPHLGHTFVPFQAFNFHLSGIQSEEENDDKLVVKIIKGIFKDNNVVLAHIESKIKNKLGSVLGSISLNNGLDLASFLVEEQLAIDKTYNKVKSNCISLNENMIKNSINSSIDESFVRKSHSSPLKSFENNFHKIHKKQPDIELIEKEPNDKKYELIDLTEDDIPIVTQIDVNPKGLPLNDMNGKKRQNWSQIKKRIEEIQRMRKKKQLESETNEQLLTQMQVNHKNGFNMKFKQEENEEEIDWPVFKSNGFVKLIPAGCQPAPAFYDKYLKLKHK